ncbi:MAG: ABC transporter permease [Candidatus Krumholzibacteria bacterium]|nr:ABC transporter permease [Candidatus Krumholzibacteria bacterium]
MRLPLFRMYWQRSLRKPGSILLWMLIPFAFMAIYSLAFGGDGDITPRVGLAVVDRDSSLVSGFLRGAFGQRALSDLIDLKEAADTAEVAELFAREEASAALVIPAGFEDSVLALGDAPLLLLTNPRQSISPQIAEGVVGTLVSMGNGLTGIFAAPIGMIRALTLSDSVSADEVAATARAFYETGEREQGLAALADIDVSVVEEEQSGDELDEFNMAALFFPGLVMFALFTVSLSLETRFLYDRTRKVTHRIVSTPVRPARIVAEQRLYAVSFLLAVAVVSALAGGIVWRIAPVGLATAGVIVTALVLFIAGLNGAIFSLSNSVRATSAISSFVMMALVIVGGGFFPAEFWPEWMQRISRVVPTGIANLGLTRALTGREIGVSLPVLFAYSGVFFVAGIIAGRRRIT